MIADHVRLTAIWIGSFVVSALVVESYVHRTMGGVPYILPEQRAEYLKPFALLYSAYLVSILAFWFVKPFNPPSQDVASTARRRISAACTSIFNLLVVFASIQGHFSLTVDQAVGLALSFAKYLSFLVAPVNLYYFGTKPAVLDE